MESKLKLVRNLLEKRSARRKEKAFVVESPHLVEEASDRVKFFFYCENFPIVKELEEKGSIGYKISRKQFEDISQVETPQGILAVVRELEYSIRDLFRSDKTLIAFCIGVQDPGNLGTIIRTADAFGASGIILSKGTVDLYNPKVVRSTMGAIFHLPIITVDDDMETIGQIKGKGIKVIASSLSGRKKIYDIELKGPIALLIGNEGAGLPEEIVSSADEAVLIPMAGKAESLNAGIAASIMLYETAKQRSK
jgi:TrmH family RNA methyltransferase